MQKADFLALKKKFKLIDVSQLYDDGKPTDKTHLQNQDKAPPSESLQEGLKQPHNPIPLS